MNPIVVVGPSQHCKVLLELSEKLLSVDVLWKGIFRLLGCSVAALKVSNLNTDKNIILGHCIVDIIPLTALFNCIALFTDSVELKRDKLPFQRE